MATISSWTYPFRSYLLGNGSVGCMLRALIHSEIGLEHCLQNLPKRFGDELQAQNSRGRAAQEHGDWETANDSFVKCRNMMLRQGVEDRLGRLVYCYLVAWANHFLAQLNQAMGGVEVLETAMVLWREMLDLVQPLRSSRRDPHLVAVCKMYYYTAQYELGDALGSSEQKNAAIRSFSQLRSCTEDAAAAQICVLLCSDHDCFGRFDKSLRWIQEAIRIRKRNLSSWNSCKFYFLEYEAKLLMKLDKFSEAVEALEEMMQTSDDGDGIISARIVHEMLLECYTRMGRRAADIQDVQRAEEYEALTRQQQSLIDGLQPEGIMHPCQYIFPEIAFTHPLMMTKASLLGISRLGLIETPRLNCVRLQLRKLPCAITQTVAELFHEEKDARERHVWDRAIFLSEQRREILKLAKGLVDTETHRWLLAWVDLPLAGLYHYRARHFRKALTIWKEIQDCAAHKLASSGSWKLSLKDCQVPFAALEYELRYANTSVQGKYEIIQKWARAYGTDERTAERDLCFWLYFGYHLHENFGEALKWLLEAKRLREEQSGCPQRWGPRVDYFCCDYDYNRCEFELFTKLGMDERAATARESLHYTRHVQRDGLIDDDYEQGDESLEEQSSTATPTPTSTPTPTPTGCIAVMTSNRSQEILKLAQSSAGLEHHLRKLPFPIQLAFRKHSWMGRVYNLERADWENAILHYEWCQELLDFVIVLRMGNSEFEDTYEWLMAWVAVPLAGLYDKAKKYKEALDLRMHMVDLYAQTEGADESRKQLRFHIWTGVYPAAYLCSILDYSSSSDLKNKVVASAGALMTKVKNDWLVECRLMMELMTNFVTVYANYEGPLAFARQAMQWSDQRFQEPAFKLTKEYVDLVSMEVSCLRHLRRPGEAKTVLENYWRSTGKSKDELPEVVRKLLASGGIQKTDFLAFIGNPDTDLELMPSGELHALRQKNRECDPSEHDSAKEISYHEEFLKLVEENPKLEGPEHDNDVRLIFIANARIAVLCMISFYTTTLSPRPPQQVEAHNCKDEDFVRAVEYFKKCYHQVTSAGEIFGMLRSDLVAHILLHLLFVYSAAWGQCETYLSFCKSTAETKLAGLEDDVAVQPEQLEARQTQVIDTFCNEITTTFELMQQLPVLKYGLRLIMHHVRSLHTVASRQYSEGWIEWLEDYKFVYSFLQVYHARRGFLMKYIVTRSEDPDVNLAKPLIFTKREADVSFWNAFLVSEGERTRVMLYQHEMHQRKSGLGLSVQQWALDAHDNSALRRIKETYGALLTRESTVFVQYSQNSSSDGLCVDYFIYVLMMDQDHGCKLFVEESTPLYVDEHISKLPIEKKLGPMPKKRLQDLHDYLAYKTEHPDHKAVCQDKKYRRLLKSSTITDDELMNEYLEFLYDVLIGPLAKHLKPGDKLVLAPSELLTQVPFAALINRETQKRLIESHAIAMAPSLRVLQMCSERAQDLQSRSGSGDSRARIVALGDPTYDCDECTEKRRRRLKATAEEVKHIASVFGEAAVVTLTGKNATKNQLLHWASNSSPESPSRVAVVHIGAHGAIGKDENNYRNTHLQLACDASSLEESANNNASTSASDPPAASEPSTSSTRRGNPDDEPSDEDTSDSDIEDDTTISGLSPMFSPLLTRFSSIIDTGALKPSGGGPTSRRRSAEGRKRFGGPQASAHDLTVEEIDSSERQWDVEMLVLSACQTSAGRITSEGVLSLARAFMAAGVPCVVASMWKVEDDATCALMADFYDWLHVGKDVASALQSATVCSMQRHGPNAVQYWAPFNVWGVPSLRIPRDLQQ